MREVALAPIFAAAAAHCAPLSPQSWVFPSRATQLSEEHADASEYIAPLEAMLGLSNPQFPPGTYLLVLDHVAPDSRSSDLAKFEVSVAETGIHQEEMTTPKKKVYKVGSQLC